MKQKKITINVFAPNGKLIAHNVFKNEKTANLYQKYMAKLNKGYNIVREDSDKDENKHS